MSILGSEGLEIGSANLVHESMVYKSNRITSIIHNEKNMNVDPNGKDSPLNPRETASSTPIQGLNTPELEQESSSTYTWIKEKVSEILESFLEKCIDFAISNFIPLVKKFISNVIYVSALETAFSIFSGGVLLLPISRIPAMAAAMCLTECFMVNLSSRFSLMPPVSGLVLRYEKRRF